MMSRSALRFVPATLCGLAIFACLVCYTVETLGSRTAPVRSNLRKYMTEPDEIAADNYTPAGTRNGSKYLAFLFSDHGMMDTRISPALFAHDHGNLAANDLDQSFNPAETAQYAFSYNATEAGKEIPDFGRNSQPDVNAQIGGGSAAAQSHGGNDGSYALFNSGGGFMGGGGLGSGQSASNAGAENVEAAALKAENRADASIATPASNARAELNSSQLQPSYHANGAMNISAPLRPAVTGVGISTALQVASLPEIPTQAALKNPIAVAAAPTTTDVMIDPALDLTVPETKAQTSPAQLVAQSVVSAAAVAGDTGDEPVAHMPEPSAFVLLLTGLSLAVYARRRYCA